MTAKRTYHCKKCNTQFKVDQQETTPECCGQPMTVQPLDQCTVSATAEHSRFDDMDDPCDDGRAG